MTGQGTTIEITGQCAHCSWRDRNVFHPTPWCPKIPALLMIDSNAGDLLDDGRYIRWGHTNRPVDVGEFVLILDKNDGPTGSFVTWGRVVRFGQGARRTIVEAEEVGRTPGNGWLYIDDALAADSGGFGSQP